MKKKAHIRNFGSNSSATPGQQNQVEKKVYYVLKIKGKAKIPDYVQIRDAEFTLIGYFRPDRKEKLGKTILDPQTVARLDEVIESIPYGKIEKVEV